MRKWDIAFDTGAVTCNICHRHSDGRYSDYGMKIAKIKYYTQDYGSNNRKGKICKRLQKHPHEIWICDKCLDDFRSEWWSKSTERMRIWGYESRL